MKRSPALAAAVFCAALAASSASAPTPGATQAPSAGDWTHEQLIAAFKQSGRNLELSKEQFDEVQVNRQRALKTVQGYLADRFGQADPQVLAAFTKVPREYFQYNYSTARAFSDLAYEEKAKPWAIGYGSALSDYLGQVYMTQLARPQPTDVVLEIGTGSGYQVALLSRIVKKAYSIEIIEPLGNAVAKIFQPLDYRNIETRVGDGYYGWPEVSEGFDIIIVTCAAQYVPPPLFKQLKPGGRLVIPIGQPFKKGQILYVYTKDEQGRIHSRKDVGVYFIPMTGELMRRAQSS